MSKPSKRGAARLLAVVAGLAIALGTVPAHVAAVSPWTELASPSPGTDYDFAYAVSGRSMSDVWAVGEEDPGHGGLIEHWDGATWSVSTTPTIAVDPVLAGVATVSATDAWAVGYAYENGLPRTVIERWDGQSWQSVPSPNPGTYDFLYGVAAVSASDVWAVGYAESSTSSAPALIEQWDGSRWNVVQSPAVAYPAALRAIAVVSADDIWAVGGAGHDTLVEHWDGTAWSVVKSPSPSTATHYSAPSNVLFGLTAVAADDIWAVGTYNTTKASNAADHTLVEHWDGMRWSLVDSPDAFSGYGTDDRLQGVAAISPADVWAVGSAHDYAHPAQTLVEHWNGSVWSIVTSPVNTAWSALFAVAAIPGTAHLIAGGADAASVYYEGAPIDPRTLILEH